ncbi:phosphoribosylformimino-5-aminoimidazole carboxamide ribotide isomerase [Caldicellulosiruptor obsidiansis OB47]|uniref:1-(5-phosphoribosyl)-5-[(5-phosphoribosylamino)methylideneamino] imidazole-4-carboxamide isomerase n=1 Tax=Caldicellulosiruptor obsidiansis (strain ATCC BAA-2073 / JCM 16842 / OB47) TaxID=608506 RepID=D9TK47_CALOO|nr:1-(5-phosphoribosyl)-5-[(5-phosphoribosylamino)methylideneamino]imidazole-4-carboxamide isomerase [Caldicellulosiruptor obsidiansis]ADL42379.1 phosphoribosylformimino-5-aminoimidazole carboxamide ribotide isomerase [Caldicellulosiruptor obsidiansis OB47]
MIVIPAIDIIDGKCVRLTQGDYNQVQLFNLDPVEQAKFFEKSGAKYIHVVDLDGAKTGKPVNFEVIKKIKISTCLTVECGGGIRDKATVELYLSSGIDYIIFGSVIFKNPDFVNEVINLFGKERFIASLDFKDGFVKLSGWQEATTITIEEGITTITNLGFERLIYTDITTDGMLRGHNFEAAKYIRKLFNGFLTASGGISSTEDIVRLKSIGVDAAIVGKALYTGQLKLEEIINIL